MGYADAEQNGPTCATGTKLDVGPPSKEIEADKRPDEGRPFEEAHRMRVSSAGEHEMLAKDALEAPERESEIVTVEMKPEPSMKNSVELAAMRASIRPAAVHSVQFPEFPAIISR